MKAATAAPPLVLGRRSAGALMTPEEFDAVTEYDENYLYELIHGVLVVNPIALADETDPNEQLGFLLRLYRESHPQGRVLDATMPQQYVRTATGRRIADRLLWIGLGRLPNRDRDVANIAVEFVSAGKRNRKRDYEEKRREYMAVGIGEYWIINRFERNMTVVINDPTGPRERVVPEHETYSTPLLPGFELPLGQLIALASQWQSSEDDD